LQKNRELLTYQEIAGIRDTRERAILLREMELFRGFARMRGTLENTSTDIQADPQIELILNDNASPL
jgi:hypothetical protein